MSTLLHQRCFNHAAREAVARCPECGQFYCRECITEHDDRMICNVCLARETQPPLAQRGFFGVAVRLLQLGAGLAAVWLIFYLLGSLMIYLPSSFHDGSIWQGNWLDEP